MAYNAFINSSASYNFLSWVFYFCVNISKTEDKARFIEGFKPNTRLYFEERAPLNLDSAILLAKISGPRDLVTHKDHLADKWAEKRANLAIGEAHKEALTQDLGTKGTAKVALTITITR